MNNPVIIFGARGLGKVALDIFHSNDVVVYCFLDDDKELHGKEENDIAVLGRTDEEEFLQYIGKKCEAFVASDDNDYRRGVIETLNKKRKVMPVNAIHGQAMVSELAFFGYGNLVNAGAVINANAKIGNHTIISSGAVVDFDADISDYVQIGAGSSVGSGSRVAEGAFIGSGVTVVSGVKIGKNARVGAGAVVVKDVKDGDTVFGNPAQSVKSFSEK